MMPPVDQLNHVGKVKGGAWCPPLLCPPLLISVIIFLIISCVFLGDVKVFRAVRGGRGGKLKLKNKMDVW